MASGQRNLAQDLVTFKYQAILYVMKVKLPLSQKVCCNLPKESNLKTLQWTDRPTIPASEKCHLILAVSGSRLVKPCLD